MNNHTKIAPAAPRNAASPVDKRSVLLAVFVQLASLLLRVAAISIRPCHGISCHAQVAWKDDCSLELTVGPPHEVRLVCLTSLSYVHGLHKE